MLSVAGQVVIQNLIATSTTAASIITNKLSVGTTSTASILNVGGDLTMGGTGGTGTLTVGDMGTARTVVTGGILQNYFGTEANPRITFNRDSTASGQAGFLLNNNGALTTAANGAAISSPAAKTLGLFTSDGSVLQQRLTINTSGFVGIGTTTPTANLTVLGGGITYASLAPSTFFLIASSSAGTATSTLFSVLSSGNVGVGTTSPTGNFVVYNPSATTTIYCMSGTLGGQGCQIVAKDSHGGTCTLTYWQSGQMFSKPVACSASGN
jgi:hypothetical protein